MLHHGRQGRRSSAPGRLRRQSGPESLSGWRLFRPSPNKPYLRLARPRTCNHYLEKNPHRNQTLFFGLRHFLTSTLPPVPLKYPPFSRGCSASQTPAHPAALRNILEHFNRRNTASVHEHPSKMVEYVPAPADLSRLNPIQRYMQKGTLDWNDYYWLIGIVLVYIWVRPAIQKFFAYAIGGNEAEEEGEAERAAYYERRAKVGPNTIRGGKDEPVDVTTDAVDGTTSGASLHDKGAISNRKAKGPKGEKSEADKLLDWDDEPSRGSTTGDKSDVVQWLEKWDKEAAS